jgi:hypothetical protein
VSSRACSVAWLEGSCTRAAGAGVQEGARRVWGDLRAVLGVCSDGRRWKYSSRRSPWQQLGGGRGYAWRCSVSGVETNHVISRGGAALLPLASGGSTRMLSVAANAACKRWRHAQPQPHYVVSVWRRVSLACEEMRWLGPPVNQGNRPRSKKRMEAAS